MAYLNNYPETCRSRATNPEFPLDLLKSIKREFEKGMRTGMFDPVYVAPKLAQLTQHVEWCRLMAEEEEWEKREETETAQFPDELDDPNFYDEDGPMGV